MRELNRNRERNGEREREGSSIYAANLRTIVEMLERIVCVESRAVIWVIVRRVVEYVKGHWI